LSLFNKNKTQEPSTGVAQNVSDPVAGDAGVGTPLAQDPSASAPANDMQSMAGNDTGVVSEPNEGVSQETTSPAGVGMGPSEPSEPSPTIQNPDPGVITPSVANTESMPVNEVPETPSEDPAQPQPVQEQVESTPEPEGGESTGVGGTGLTGE